MSFFHELRRACDEAKAEVATWAPHEQASVEAFASFGQTTPNPDPETNS